MRMCNTNSWDGFGASFFELQKNDLKCLKSLSRIQNRTLEIPTVPERSQSRRAKASPLWSL
jgi:hypothetical protein